MLSERPVDHSVRLTRTGPPARRPQPEVRDSQLGDGRGGRYAVSDGPAPLARRRLPNIDLSAATAARLQDYLLGGLTNFTIDRIAAHAAFGAGPGGLDTARAWARAGQAFRSRSIRWLAAAGASQILDIGTGVPRDPAHLLAPAARVLYVDPDSVVLALAHELRDGDRSHFIVADLSDPAGICKRASKALDFSRPIALLLLESLQFIADDDAAHRVVDELIAALAPGSWVALSHLTDHTQPATAAATAGPAEAVATPGRLPLAPRHPTQLSRFFDGLTLLAPGLVSVDQWHAGEAATGPGRFTLYGGIARKP